MIRSSPKNIVLLKPGDCNSFFCRSLSVCKQQRSIREVSGIQLIIFPLLGDQIVVGSPLDDPALLHDHDTVGILDCGKPVGDDKGGASLHQGVHAGLHQLLGAGVNGGRRFVQDEGGRVGHGGPGDGQKLALSLA